MRCSPGWPEGWALKGRPRSRGPPRGQGSTLSYTRLTVDARCRSGRCRAGPGRRMRQRDAGRPGHGARSVRQRQRGPGVDRAVGTAARGQPRRSRMWPRWPGRPSGVLAAAAVIAREDGSAQVGTEHLLVALIRHGHPEVVTLAGRAGRHRRGRRRLARRVDRRSRCRDAAGARPGPTVRGWWPAPRPVSGRRAIVALVTRDPGQLAAAWARTLLTVLVIVVVCFLGPVFGPVIRPGAGLTRLNRTGDPVPRQTICCYRRPSSSPSRRARTKFRHPDSLSPAQPGQRPGHSACPALTDPERVFAGGGLPLRSKPDPARKGPARRLRGQGRSRQGGRVSRPVGAAVRGRPVRKRAGAPGPTRRAVREPRSRVRRVWGPAEGTESVRRSPNSSGPSPPGCRRSTR
ncbi:Clp protease N-terminal domain-containing protein [Dactylosporangium sp. NPDC000555]|uniref:Clp protease N-terminal domain-containing protein n=1 Tax=Dactylosporangium sp. NPDC000555 TaxID=3154260 RepID=UPI003321926C